MLKRIFWAATITIPLYLLLALDSASISRTPNAVRLQQPQYLLGYLKERFSEFKQDLQEYPTPGVRSDR